MRIQKHLKTNQDEQNRANKTLVATAHSSLSCQRILALAVTTA